LNAPKIVYRRSAVEAVGGFAATTAIISSVWYLNMRMFLEGGLVHIGDRLTYYRCHDGNISSTAAKCPSASLIDREVFQPLKDLYREYRHHSVVQGLPPIEDAFKAQAAIVARVVLANRRSTEHAEARRDFAALLQTYVPGFDPKRDARPSLRQHVMFIMSRVLRVVRSF
jgi:hypothetical protein